MLRIGNQQNMAILKIKLNYVYQIKVLTIKLSFAL